MYRQSEKNLLNGNISSICLYNMVNVGPLTSETYWRVWGTPANSNGFRVLASLLQRRRSTEINQTLHDVWLSPAQVYYICALGGSCPFKEFCPVQNSLCLAFSYIGSVTSRQFIAAVISRTLRHGTRNGITERSQRDHLYSAGRPSR